MDTRRQFDFQTDLPVFVRAVPPGLGYIKFSGRKYKPGDHVPWQTIGIDYDVIKRFFDLHYLHHSDEKTVEHKVGDGLDEMTIEELHDLLKSLNEKVKANVVNQKDYDKYKVKFSKVRDKQIGLLRSWRRNYGKFEAM